MYILSKQLKEIGFNIDLLKNVIQRNNALLKFNTLQYFCIYFGFNDFEIKINSQEIFVNRGNAIFVGPFQIVEFSENLNPCIFNIVFTSSFYEKSKKDSLYLNSEVFFNNYQKFVTAPIFGSQQYMEALTMDRLKYFINKDKNLYLTAAHSIIESLILDALASLSFESDTNSDNINYLAIGNNFKTLIQKDYKESRSVNYYASKLCITTKKLTKITSQLYGETAKQMIIQKICNECLIALTNSNLTISEIAFEYGFSCKSNFSHFMRKHTGKIPTELRVFSEEKELAS
nr:helix-turn-helix domain-containing protein [uncultured Chryseobacterium sp.]